MNAKNIFTAVLIVFCIVTGGLCAQAAEKKPMKVFVIAGQGNAEGRASVSTLQGLQLEPVDATLRDAMVNADGSTVELDDVYVSFLSGPGIWDADRPLQPKIKQGRLGVGYGHLGRGPGLPEDPKDLFIGPEYSFGIFMHRELKEPFIIIKAAWHWRTLSLDFRPPNAPRPELSPERMAEAEAKGELALKYLDFKERQIGRYYRAMMEHVQAVLADPGKLHPAYDPEAGYELAGFIWLQGVAELNASYPLREDGTKDYGLYAEYLAQFIRDVRTDLKAPAMPFAIGVLGAGGPRTEPPADDATWRVERYNNRAQLRQAMAVPARLPEFRGTVFAVDLAKCWDTYLDPLQDVAGRIRGEHRRAIMEFNRKNPKAGRKKKRDFRREMREKMNAELAQDLDPDGLRYLNANASGGENHYMGSAKIMGRIGRAFAEALTPTDTPRQPAAN